MKKKYSGKGKGLSRTWSRFAASEGFRGYGMKRGVLRNHVERKRGTVA